MKKFLILALSAALLTAFFGCGSPKEPEQKLPGDINEDFEEIFFEPLPDSTNAATANTGENGSKMFKFTGDDFTKIKSAIPGSYLEVKYSATVAYAVGEIGWIDIANAGPVISGDATGKTQTVYYNVEDLVIGDADFTIHIFNGATLKGVTLYAAPEGYVPKANDKATAGATKIVLPMGHKIPGRGDLSKADFKKITTAASGSTLVFYFDDTAATDSGILKFGPKQGDPYKHYGIDTDGTIKDESGKGWRVADATTRTITYTVAEIKAGVTEAGPGFNKLEVNNDASGAQGVLLYIELKP